MRTRVLDHVFTFTPFGLQLQYLRDGSTSELAITRKIMVQKKNGLHNVDFSMAKINIVE